MELIVSSFLLIALSLFGHIGSVVAEQLRRRRRLVFRVADDSHDPPPGHALAHSAESRLQPVAA